MPSTAGKVPLRVLFFLDCADGCGGRFGNAPGLLPMVGDVRRRGFDIAFLDTEDGLLAALSDPQVDVVAVSSMERLLPRSVEVARKVRERRHDVVLMLGGNSIDPFAVHLASAVFDVVAVGEGEHVFPALLGAISIDRGRALVPVPVHADFRVPGRMRLAAQGECGGALSERAIEKILAASFLRTAAGPRPVTAELAVSGVYVRNGQTGEVWQADPPDPETLRAAADAWLSGLPPAEAELLRPALDGLEAGSAPAAYELDQLCTFPWEIVQEGNWPVLEFYTQRGCTWGRCDFCSVADRTVRALSPQRIVEVLAEAVRHGVGYVSFSDDLFVQDAMWNRRLLERIVTLDLGIRFRAQTMATRAVWPLLDLMRRAGFVELAFGVETLIPERARAMGKSFSGRRYVEQVRETVVRTAAAGICPVLYMILIDPRSTLAEIAADLLESARLVAAVYRQTGILPVLSYSLVMLPVLGSAMASQFPYRAQTVPLGRGSLELPAEYVVPAVVGLLIQRIATLTDQLPHRRENLEAMRLYVKSVAEVAAETGDSHIAQIQRDTGLSRDLLAGLTSELDRDVEETAESMLALARGEEVPSCHPSGDLRFQFARFGGYISGLERYQAVLTEGVAAMEAGAAGFDPPPDTCA